MGYLFLSIALICGAVKGYCGKKTSGFVKGYTEAYLMNSVRMLLCIAIGFLFVLFENNPSKISLSPTLIAISAFSGITSAFFVVFWLISVRTGAYMMLDVFAMLGIFVPIILGRIFFDEEVTFRHISGAVILVAACLIMCSYNNTIKTRLTLSGVALLIGCGLSNGLCDFSQKLFVKTLPDIPASVFNLYTYVFAAIILITFFTVSNKKAKTDIKANIKLTLGYIIIMAICLFCHSFFKTRAAVYLPSAQLYPLNQGFALILSSIMAAVFFKEKLTPRCIMGLCLAFFGLLIINL